MSIHSSVSPRLSGGLSAISSAFVIYLIVRSEIKLSTIYHRIVFGMCCVDIIGSLACSLTSLPMPTEFPDDDWYDTWDGTRLGNTRTCEAQGFFSTFGLVTMFAYNSMLCFYYALHIAARLPDVTIRKYIEPAFLHFVPLASGLGAAITPFFYDLYNPSMRDPWCTMIALGCDQNSKKIWCDLDPLDNCFDESATCYRGDFRVSELLPLIKLALISVFFATILISFSLCIWRVLSIELKLREIEKLHSPNIAHMDTSHMDTSHMDEMRSTHNNTKVILVQSLAYTTVFALTLSLVLVRSLSEYRLDEGIALLVPSTGFFNCLIFVGHKVYNYRRCHKDESTCSILYKLCFGPATKEPVVMSFISIIERDKQLEKFRVELINEWGLNQSFCMSYAPIDAKQQIDAKGADVERSMPNSVGISSGAPG